MRSDSRIFVSDPAVPERAKYTEIWKHLPEYRNYSPGLMNVERFMSVINPLPGTSLVDIGCGAGVAGLEFERRGLDVTWIDITDAGLDPAVDRSRFIEMPLWVPASGPGMKGFNYGFCCDVMEHIPPEYTMLVIDRILENCEVAWFQIALRPDEFGKAIGQPLHLTIQSFDWWKSRIASLGRLVEARDLCGEAMFVVVR